MRIVLHIGTEKTGTTTLQSALVDNKASLTEHGIAYLHSASGINAQDLAQASLPDDTHNNYFVRKRIETSGAKKHFREKVFNGYARELGRAAHDADTVIISSEHFHSQLRTVDSIKQVRELVAPYATEIEVVCYLRRQVDMVVSFYSTALKAGWSPSFSEFVERMLKPGQYYCNFRKLLDNWEWIFGRGALRVKRFGQGLLYKGDMIDDFLSVCRLPASAIKRRPANINESVNHLGQVLLREYNRTVGGGPARAVPAQVRRTRQAIADAFQGKGQQLPAARAKELQSRFDTSNEAVRAEWFPQESDLFSNEFTDDQALMLSRDQERCIRSIVAQAATHGQVSGTIREYDAYADILRDAADLVAKEDRQKAIGLLKLANIIRPEGELIRRKLARLEDENDESGDSQL